MKNAPRAKAGFTLIELLVVIAIIGILAGVILSSFTDSRKKARDAKRLTELHSIETALELYYGAHNYYPSNQVIALDTSRGNSDDGVVNNWGSQSNLQVLVTEKFLSVLPIDPLNTSAQTTNPLNNQLADNFIYNYVPSSPTAVPPCIASGANKCTRYILCARMEKLPQRVDGFGRYCITR